MSIGYSQKVFHQYSIERTTRAWPGNGYSDRQEWHMFSTCSRGSNYRKQLPELSWHMT